MEGTKLIETNAYFEQTARELGIWTRELTERIATHGSLEGVEDIPDEVKQVFVTAHDIAPVDHIRMQAAFQKSTDNAVSKTVNFANSATAQDVREVYMLAYKLACKGVTVYRDGSREDQVLSTKKTEDERKETGAVEDRVKPKKRPEVIRGTTRRMKTGCGYLYVTINEDENGLPFEVFTNIGKAGGCAGSQAEAMGRLISLALRSNMEPELLIKELKGISCHQPSWAEGGRILSCSDAIGKALERYIPDPGVQEKGNGKSRHGDVMIIGACPECGGAVEHEGGCAFCHNCGFSKC